MILCVKRKLRERAKNRISIPPKTKIPEYPTYPTSKPPTNEPKAVPRGENIVSKAPASLGWEEKILDTKPDLAELDIKFPNSNSSLRIRIPINPRKIPNHPINKEKMPNDKLPIRIFFKLVLFERICNPIKEIGRNKRELSEE